MTVTPITADAPVVDKKAAAAIYSLARAEILKRHNDEYRELVKALASQHGVTMRTRRTADEKAAAEAARVAQVEANKVARAEAKAAKVEAVRLEKIAKAKAVLAALGETV